MRGLLAQPLGPGLGSGLGRQFGPVWFQNLMPPGVLNSGRPESLVSGCRSALRCSGGPEHLTE